MNFNHLEALSPVDGRYRSKVNQLADYFSEKALIKYRLEVEVHYFQALYDIPLPELAQANPDQVENLKNLYTAFDLNAAEAIKKIEETTNHDVKAVEYYIKEKLETYELHPYREFVHFGLTSQDINNTAIPLSIERFLVNELYPKLKILINLLNEYGGYWKDTPMLSRTHGQPASPTRLGKEIQVFSERLQKQFDLLKKCTIYAKFGGATGNFNAHYLAYPDIDWHGFADRFVSGHLGLARSFPTTQIEHYDSLATVFDNIKRINTILIDCCRDIWQYIAMNYFTQKIEPGEIGSSAMPHKVNPIDFENAEGNLGLANALFEHLSAKLPISRLQRDLTDSTVLRNVGVPMAHTYLSLSSIIKGFGKIEKNDDAIRADLDNHWAVVTEGIQTILRRIGYPNPYEALLQLTRSNKKITRQTIIAFIDDLEVEEDVREELLNITPFTYTGR